MADCSPATAVNTMDSIVIPAAEYRRERWRNGLGWTSEISRGGGEPDWAWRISIAEIDADAAFSRFTGVDRDICLLSGNGVDLCFDDGSRAALEPPHGRHRFGGERALHAELRDGPVRVCNLMWRRDRVLVGIWRRPLVGSMVMFAEPGETWLLHLLAGQAGCVANGALANLSVGDTVVVRSSTEGRERFAIEGGGEALIARITDTCTGVGGDHLTALRDGQ